MRKLNATHSYVYALDGSVAHVAVLSANESKSHTHRVESGIERHTYLYSTVNVQ